MVRRSNHHRGVRRLSFDRIVSLRTTCAQLIDQKAMTLRETLCLADPSRHMWMGLGAILSPWLLSNTFDTIVKGNSVQQPNIPWVNHYYRE